MMRHEAEHLLEHWIEHNDSHSSSFRQRAVQIREISIDAASYVEEAALLMDRCNAALRKAREILSAEDR
jgi:hypothetical protein